MKRSLFWILMILLAFSLLFVSCNNKKEPDNPTKNEETTNSDEITTQSPCAVNGHLFGVWYTTTEPTCTETGMERHDCENCDYYEQQRVAAGHTEVSIAPIAPTCTEQGLSEGKYCSACNTVLVEQTVVAALGHKLENNVCTVCQYSDGLGFELRYDDTYSVKVNDASKLPAELIIPATYCGKPITTIESNAFIDCIKLTSVTIPDSITYIGQGAFMGCTRLTEITLPVLGDTTDGNYATYLGYIFGSYLYQANDEYVPTSLKSVVVTGGTRIGKGAFYGCTGLTSITIADSITFIDQSAFADCTGLTDLIIPNSVTTIGKYAFNGCTGLSSISIPDSVISLGDGAFTDCTNLTNVSIGNNVTSIGDNAFKGCTNLASISIGNNVTTIGQSAFSDCISLIDIVIPDSVTTISDYAFDGCLGLTSVIIPNSVIEIGTAAFSDCTGLTSVILGENVAIIGSSAFKGCTGFTSITMGESVTNIGSSAFSGCKGLTSITIPNSVTSIGKSAFYNCSGLTEITIPFVGATKDGSSDTYFGYIFGAFSYNTNGLYVSSSLKSVIITGGTYIDKGAFYKCEGLSSITIADSITSIGDSAFELCTGLTSITIPRGVISIGEFAFEDCRGLTSIAIPSNVKNINYGAFNLCTGLTSVHITNMSAWCEIVFADETANPLYYAGQLYLNGDLVTKLVIPNNISKIGNYAFYNCTALTDVTIPANITYIGQNAFYGCSALTSATFAKTSEWRLHDDSTNAGLNSTALSTPTDAAKALNKYYYKYYWTRA